MSEYLDVQCAICNAHIGWEHRTAPPRGGVYCDECHEAEMVEMGKTT